MKDQILTICANQHKLITNDALEYIMSKDDPIPFINTALKHFSSSKVFLNKDDFINILTGDEHAYEPPKTIVPKNPRVYGLKVLQDSDVTGKSTSTGQASDFAKYIQYRYNALSHIIESKMSFGRAVSSGLAKKHSKDDCKLIGIVYSQKKTKNGHTLLELEDKDGMFTAMILKDSPIISETFVNDEVIGIVGKFNVQGTLFIIKQVVRPDVPKDHKWELSDSYSNVLFLSDLHIGSKQFNEKYWQNTVDWIKHNGEDKCINYFVISGDVCDGVGAYPDQEFDLELLDIYDQYNAVAEHFKEIPDDVKIIMHPGNHDATRIAEPQPALKSIYTKSFDSNITMTGSPISFEIEGRTITSYHGKSMDAIIPSMKGMSYDNPVGCMTRMLQWRHLGPMYGTSKLSLVPEPKDYLVVAPVPDILCTGHIHKSQVGLYKGVRLINASSLQEQTDYQKQHNFKPTPGILTTVHLGSGAVNTYDMRKV